MTVHYPHHPLFGKRVRRQGVDHRKGGAVAHIETTPGDVIVIPTWMLDPIACAGMEIGEPRASLEALIELAKVRGHPRQLPKQLTRRFQMKLPTTIPPEGPRQMIMAFDSVKTRGMSPAGSKKLQERKLSRYTVRITNGTTTDDEGTIGYDRPLRTFLLQAFPDGNRRMRRLVRRIS
ncbi:hypothetical protein [Sinorhizobium meliloti]|uniref:hypothetical protein n=1 Tax=Rhizobium meliloti TaxID=382 RepID=UPI001F1CE994|nr:hypothetical protein [Sinorhizobium meliloti]